MLSETPLAYGLSACKGDFLNASSVIFSKSQNNWAVTPELNTTGYTLIELTFSYSMISCDSQTCNPHVGVYLFDMSKTTLTTLSNDNQIGDNLAFTKGNAYLTKTFPVNVANRKAVRIGWLDNGGCINIKSITIKGKYCPALLDSKGVSYPRTDVVGEIIQVSGTCPPGRNYTKTPSRICQRSAEWGSELDSCVPVNNGGGNGGGGTGSSSSSSSSAGVGAGVGGGIAAVAIIGVILFLLWRQRNSDSEKNMPLSEIAKMRLNTSYAALRAHEQKEDQMYEVIAS